MANIAVQLKSYVDEMSALNLQNENHEFVSKFWNTSTDFETSRTVYLAASSSISAAITKFTLVVQGNPNEEAYTSVCTALFEPCEQLYMATKMALFSGAGQCLSRHLLNTTRPILQGVYDVLCAKDGKNVKELTGRVWEYTEAAVRVPTSNQGAIKRELFECMAILKDSLMELEELEEEAQQPVHDEFMENEDPFHYEIDFEAIELSRLSFFIVVVKYVVLLNKMGIKSIAFSRNDTPLEMIVPWSEKIVKAFTALRRTSIEVMPTLYPPQERSELEPLVNSWIEAARYCHQVLTQDTPFEKQGNMQWNTTIEDKVLQLTTSFEQP